MTSLRGGLLAIGAAGLLAAGALVAAGCSGDNSSSAGDAGPAADATGDTSTDSGPEQDSSTTETGVDSSIPPTDSSTPPDTGTPEQDAGDAQPVDAGPTAAQKYATALATAICAKRQPCCPSGVTYDLQACANNLQGYGWEGNLPADQTILTSSHITVDSAKATACIAAAGGLACSTDGGTGAQTASAWSAVTQACIGVIQGTIAIGTSGCRSSFECVPGSYCSPAGDGGVGTCTALATQGQACDTAIKSSVNPIPDEMCSYLGSSDTGLFCDLIDPVNSANYATCQPLLAAGASCFGNNYFDDQACPTNAALCGDNLLCGGSASYPYAGNTGECSFIIADAGKD